MIKIPGETNKFSISNNSDLFGSLWYVRGINMDEEGYMKLSPRMVSIKNQADEANLGLPFSFGRYGFPTGTLNYFVVTNSEPYKISVSSTALSVTEDTDTGNPTLTSDSHGRWFHNLWIVTDTNDFFSKDPGTGTYTDRGNLTAGKHHPVEIFRNRDTICFGDGNTVVQYTESGGTFTATTTLTLPADYEVIKLAYANNRMAVLTELSDQIAGQNQEVYLFIWDGATTQAEQGIPIGSERGIDVVAYKGTFAVLTKTGQLSLYSGGSLQPVAALPFYFQDRIWSPNYSRDVYGDAMSVEGDIIYFNLNGYLGAFGSRYETYSVNNPGGIWCYDPNVGIYCRYQPSISKASNITVSDSNVDTTADIMTISSGTIPPTGNEIKYLGPKTQKIGGLQSPNVYYVIKITSTQFALATTKQNALDGVKVDLTSAGASTNYFLAIDTVDFGQSQMVDVGGMTLINAKNEIYDGILAGSQMVSATSDTEYYNLCMSADLFHNRGYLVTPKVNSSNIEDVMSRIFISYRPLKSGDSIIVKYRNREINSLPVSTSQKITTNRNQCTWTSSTVFTTTANLADAYTAYQNNESLECEVIAGAGGGTLVQISTIQYSAGTYTVTVAEEVLGAASGRYCDVVIDNWKQCVNGIITSDDRDTSNYKEIAIDRQSSWVQFKIELRGVDTAIRDIKITNSKAK